jgi:hypothetical protein
MSLDEKLDISLKAIELRKAGDEEGYMRIMKTIPMLPHMAKGIKKVFGSDFLIKMGWDLSEAELEFGSDWLNK